MFGYGGVDWIVLEHDNKGAEKEAFMTMITKLTEDNGFTYGSCFDQISLISCQQYLEYMSVFPNVDGQWWTSTVCSTNDNGCDRLRLVGDNGVLRNGGVCFDSRVGVRPLCTLKSGTKARVTRCCQKISEP